MKAKTIRHQRILSIDPNCQGFGFAVIEVADRLIEWGMTRISPRKQEDCLSRIAKLIERYAPDVIVTSDPNKPCRRGSAVQRLISEVQLLACKKRIRTGKVSRMQVRQFFSQTSAGTKDAIAAGIVRFFPELQSRLPKPRKPWNSQDRRMAMFDAIALTLAWLDSK